MKGMVGGAGKGEGAMAPVKATVMHTQKAAYIDR
jgi:hypothetical protein